MLTSSVPVFPVSFFHFLQVYKHLHNGQGCFAFAEKVKACNSMEVTPYAPEDIADSIEMVKA